MGLIEGDKKYIELLLSNAEESVRFFSSEMKPERERVACAAFLRCLGLPFSVDQIESVSDEPPDINFDSARFEIMEILDEGRLRHKEYKEKVEKIKASSSIDELTEKWTSPKPISFEEVLSLITSSLSKKSSKYGHETCSNLDALVYVDFEESFLNPNTPVGVIDDL